jgi:hypothetical protein
LSVYDEDIVEEFEHIERVAVLNVVSPTEIHGKIDLFGNWSTSDE